MMGREQQIHPVTAGAGLQQTPSMRYNDGLHQSDMMTSGGYGSFQGQGQIQGQNQGQGRLSAHDLALNPTMSQQGANRPYDSPTLVVTGADAHRMQGQMMQGPGGTLGVQGNVGPQKKESFAAALKKRLGRGTGNNKRSQSADRGYSSSVREGTLLKPPGSAREPTPTGNFEFAVEYSIDEQKGRSNSFGSSIKRIFKPSKNKDLSAMRGSSLTRPSPTQQEAMFQQQNLSAGGSLSPYSTQQQQQHLQMQQQQQQQQQQQDMFNRSRQTTPVPPLSGTAGLQQQQQYHDSRY